MAGSLFSGFDTWQEVLEKYPPEYHTGYDIDTEEEKQCYKLGVQDGFEAAQP